MKLNKKNEIHRNKSKQMYKKKNGKNDKKMKKKIIDS